MPQKLSSNAILGLLCLMCASLILGLGLGLSYMTDVRTQEANSCLVLCKGIKPVDCYREGTHLVAFCPVGGIERRVAKIE